MQKNANTSMEKIWKRVQKIKGKITIRLPPLLTSAFGIETQNPSETSNIFGEAVASVSSTENYTQHFQLYKRTQEGKSMNFTSKNVKAYNTSFSMEESHHALTTTKETSPGYDQFTYSIIKNSHITLQTAILNLYNKIFLMKFTLLPGQLPHYTNTKTWQRSLKASQLPSNLTHKQSM